MLTKSFATACVAVLLIGPLSANAEKPTPVTVVDPVLSVEVSNANPVPTTVNNTPANSVPVRPGGQPLQVEMNLNQDRCGSGFCSGTIYHVPPGKLLIIEHVGMRTDTTNQTELFDAIIGTQLDGPRVIEHQLGLLSRQPGIGANAQHYGSFPVQLYAGPDTDVYLGVSLGDFYDIRFLLGTLSGRLVDY